MSEPSKTELENDNDAVTVTVCNKCPRAITLKVAQFSIKKYGKPLCMKCQESEK